MPPGRSKTWSPACSRSRDEAGDWRPIEDPADTTDPLTGDFIGRGFDWYILRCPVSFEHPISTVMQ
jgi:hypothetical protein